MGIQHIVVAVLQREVKPFSNHHKPLLWTLTVGAPPMMLLLMMLLLMMMLLLPSSKD